MQIHWILVVFLIVQLACSVVFYRKQNQGALVGGPISWPKALWLYFAIFFWYLVPLVYAFNPEIDLELRLLIGFHLLSWWIRAPIELVMIYRFFNWTPRYGISHDVFHNVVLFAGIVGVSQSWDSTPENWAAVFLISSLFILICFEISFAALFLGVRGDQDHKIYYATNEPKWRFINWLTKVGLGFGYVAWVLQILFWAFR